MIFTVKVDKSMEFSNLMAWGTNHGMGYKPAIGRSLRVGIHNSHCDMKVIILSLKNKSYKVLICMLNSTYREGGANQHVGIFTFTKIGKSRFQKSQDKTL
jgi:hypothetical protein